MRPVRFAAVPLTALLIATTMAFARRSQQASPITVGREVEVSGADTLSAYSEYDGDVDPANPNRIMLCAQPYVPDLNERKGTVHISNDAGRSWRLALEVKAARPGLLVADPACAFGPGGVALLSIDVASEEGGVGGGNWQAFPGGRGQRIYRSTDGGRTWEPPVFIGFVDNQNLLVDRTGGRFDGRIYMHGNSGGNALWLAYSTDTGRTFTRGALGPAEAPAWRQIDRGVVLADGTVLLPYRVADRRNPNQPDAPATTTHGVSRSTDGGVHLQVPDTVSVANSDCGFPPPQTLPHMAVDNSRGPFRGRVYYLWGEVESPSSGRAAQAGIAPRCVVVVSSSDDHGKTWSPAVQVTDAPYRTTPNKGPDAKLPAIAVNSRGVVGVSWYDRREDPDNGSARMRFSASLDGGDTWLPSVPVSTKMLSVDGSKVFSLQSRVSGGGGGGRAGRGGSDVATTAVRAEVRQNPMGIGGDYSVLVADSSGTFHPFWVDNRGNAAEAGHMFTAPVTVRGAVVRNGSAELASLDNVTSKLQFQYHYTRNRWDAGVLHVDLGLVLKNVSSDTIVGPLKLRILGVRSLGGPVILRETRAEAAGSVLDMTSTIPANGLAPGASARLYEIRLRAGPSPADLASEGPFGLGSFSAKVFARVRR